MKTNHAMYYYNIGGEVYNRKFSYKGGGTKSRLAAKCLCGWEGVGPEDISQHEAIVEAELNGES